MRSNEITLRKAIEEMIASYKLKENLYEVRIRNSWRKLMGPMIDQHTKEIRLVKGELIVIVDMAALKEELGYARVKIKELINKEFGEELVKQVRII